MDCKNVRSARECIEKNETATCITSHFAKVINYGIGNLAKVNNFLIGIYFAKAINYVYFLNRCILDYDKKVLRSDGRSAIPPISRKRTVEQYNTTKITTYAVGNPCPALGQSLKCGGVVLSVRSFCILSDELYFSAYSSVNILYSIYTISFAIHIL